MPRVFIEHKYLLFSVKTHTDVIFTIWIGQLVRIWGLQYWAWG